MQSQSMDDSNEQRSSYKNAQSRETGIWNRVKNYVTTPKPQDKGQSTLSENGRPHHHSGRNNGTPIIHIAPAPEVEADIAMQRVNHRGRRQTHHTDEAYLSPNHRPGFSQTQGQSKSDQMLSRLLKDQLQLAYSDYQNNLRCAQSPAALEHLRNSQPRIDITPSSSRHASPHRQSVSANVSPRSGRRSRSPALYKPNDFGSSGSEHSYTGNIGPAPPYSQAAAGRSKSCTTSRAQSPCHQHQAAARTASLSQTGSLRNSPLRKGPSTPKMYNLNGTNSRGGSTSDLVKNAHFNLLWAFILDAITTGRLEEFGVGDPKQWWRKLFQTIKLMHGKGKAFITTFCFFFL